MSRSLLQPKEQIHEMAQVSRIPQDNKPKYFCCFEFVSKI